MISDFDEINKLFDKINRELGIKVNAYIIGGAALMTYGEKSYTKDIDIVFNSQAEFEAFRKTLHKLGFKTKIADKGYSKLELQHIYIKGDMRFDIFNSVVCQGLSLSDNMIKRAKPINKLTMLAIFVISLEDIFLFKSITEKEGDVEDSVNIVRKRAIDWDTILNEIQYQIKKHNKKQWIADLHNRLIELEQRYGLKAKIREDVEKEVGYYYDLLELSLKLKEKPLTITEIKAATGIKNVEKLIDWVPYPTALL